jgi:hypothetical protein
MFGLSADEASEVGVDLEGVIRCELGPEADASFVVLVVFMNNYTYG